MNQINRVTVLLVCLIVARLVHIAFAYNVRIQQKRINKLIIDRLSVR